MEIRLKRNSYAAKFSKEPIAKDRYCSIANGLVRISATWLCVLNINIFDFDGLGQDLLENIVNCHYYVSDIRAGL
jgi:hypothetical protein